MDLFHVMLIVDPSALHASRQTSVSFTALLNLNTNSLSLKDQKLIFDINLQLDQTTDVLIISLQPLSPMLILIYDRQINF